MTEEFKQEEAGEISLDELVGDIEMQATSPAKTEPPKPAETQTAESQSSRIQALAASVGEKAGDAVKAAGMMALKQMESASASVVDAVKKHGPDVMDRAKETVREGASIGVSAAKTGIRSFVKAAFFGFAGIGILLVVLLLVGRSTPDEPKPWYSFGKDPQPTVGRYIDKGTQRLQIPKIELRIEK